MDTVRIQEVIVSGRPSLYGSASKATIVDSLVLRDYSHNNISDVLSENASIFIKNYGSGGTATISLRGTGAGYTKVDWNGVSLNSPMLGQSDLAILPSGFIDEINIYYGGASLFLGSGGLGGTINLSTRPVWTDQSDFQANLSMGSFGKYSAFLKARTGTENFQSSTKALIQTSKNDFPYINNFVPGEAATERRKNSSTNQNSFMEELFFKGRNHVITARVWYQNTFRNIPVPVIIQQPENGENMRDETLRSIVSYSTYRSKTNLSSSLSWVSDNMIYRNPILSVNSKNLSNTLALKSDMERHIDEKTSYYVSINDELDLIKTVNYDGRKYRNTAGLTFSLNHKISNRFDVSLLVRDQLSDNILMAPDFSSGLRFILDKNRNSNVHFGISRNSKLPTLNDKYWNPGGNSLLKNESSYTGELSYEDSWKISPELVLNGQATIYKIQIKNMIRWTPGNYGYWSPSNVDRSSSYGAEGNLGLSYCYNRFSIKVNAKYSWNHSSLINSSAGEDIIGKQLIYMPEHLINGSLRASYKYLYLSWLSAYTSKRYTTADNSNWLSGYNLNSMSVGANFHITGHMIDISLKSENIFNASYQTIAWYPMPGRSWYISLIYQFSK